MDNLEKTRKVVEAIASLQDHGNECFCTHCEIDRQVIAKNPEIVEAVIPLVKKGESK